MKYLVLVLLWLCIFNGAANVKITMTLPTTQESRCGEVDVDPNTLQPVPLTDLSKVIHTAYKCNGDSIRFPDIDVRGMEGDSLGIDYEFDPGTMGRIVYRTADLSGNISCGKREHTFIVPAEYIPPPPPPDTSTTGIKGYYYAGQSRNTYVGDRRDGPIDFLWGLGSAMPGVPVDFWSAQWIGKIVIPTAGIYTFYVEVDDGARLVVDGGLYIDKLGEFPLTEYSTTLNLTAGEHVIDLVYTARTGNAQLSLKWQGPGIPKQVIPRGALR